MHDSRALAKGSDNFDSSQFARSHPLQQLGSVHGGDTACFRIEEALDDGWFRETWENLGLSHHRGGQYPFDGDLGQFGLSLPGCYSLP